MDSRGNKSKDDLDDTHLHLEHLLRLLRRLELEGDLRKEKVFSCHKKELILSNFNMKYLHSALNNLSWIYDNSGYWVVRLFVDWHES